MKGKKSKDLEEVAFAVIDKNNFRRRVAEIREKKLREEAELTQKSSAHSKNKSSSKPTGQR